MTDIKYMFRQDDTSNVDGLAHGCMTDDEKNISKHVGYAYPEKSLRLLALSSVVARGPLRGCFERVDVKGSLTAQKLFEVQVFRCG